MLNPLTQYKEQAINTMSKGELLVALFDEALKNMKYGKLLMEEDNFTASKKCTEKCKNIFNYLCVSLNRDYGISQNLFQIYTFINQQIIRAEVKRDPSLLDEITPLVSELRDTWAQAEKLIHIK